MFSLLMALCMYFYFLIFFQNLQISQRLLLALNLSVIVLMKRECIDNPSQSAVVSGAGSGAWCTESLCSWWLLSLHASLPFSKSDLYFLVLALSIFKLSFHESSDKCDSLLVFMWTVTCYSDHFLCYSNWLLFTCYSNQLVLQWWFTLLQLTVTVLQFVFDWTLTVTVIS